MVLLNFNKSPPATTSMASSPSSSQTNTASARPHPMASPPPSSAVRQAHPMASPPQQNSPPRQPHPMAIPTRTSSLRAPHPMASPPYPVVLSAPRTPHHMVQQPRPSTDNRPGINPPTYEESEREYARLRKESVRRTGIEDRTGLTGIVDTDPVERGAGLEEQEAEIERLNFNALMRADSLPFGEAAERYLRSLAPQQQQEAEAERLNRPARARSPLPLLPEIGDAADRYWGRRGPSRQQQQVIRRRPVPQRQALRHETPAQIQIPNVFLRDPQEPLCPVFAAIVMLCGIILATPLGFMCHSWCDVVVVFGTILTVCLLVITEDSCTRKWRRFWRWLNAVVEDAARVDR